MKPVKMRSRTWAKVKQKMRSEYPPSYFIRDKMKEKLGFTVRQHTAYIANKNYSQEYAAYEEALNSADEMNLLLCFPPERGQCRTEIHLDFYSENKRTMFLLRYSEELADDNQRN